MSPITAAWSYDFSSAIVEPPTSNQIRFDAGAPYTTVAKMWVRIITRDGIDLHTWLMAIQTGSSLYVQDQNDHTAYAAFKTIGSPVDKVSYVELPVAWTDNGNALNNNQAVQFAANVPPPDTTTDQEPIPAPPAAADLGPDLVTVTEAATYLRVVVSTAQPEITDDLTRLVGMASDQIRDYLKGRNDPLWTPTTAPPRVRDAVLLLIGNRWEHKGDDVDPRHDRDEGCWKAIERVLWRTRDPAWA